MALPKQLPERLTGENYVTKQSSVRIVRKCMVRISGICKRS